MTTGVIENNAPDKRKWIRLMCNSDPRQSEIEARKRNGKSKKLT